MYEYCLFKYFGNGRKKWDWSVIIEIMWIIFFEKRNKLRYWWWNMEAMTRYWFWITPKENIGLSFRIINSCSFWAIILAFDTFYKTNCIQKHTIPLPQWLFYYHYRDVIMNTRTSQITSLAIVYSTVYSGADQRKLQKLCVTGLCEGNSPVTDVFPAKRTSNAVNVSIWWRHHDKSVGQLCQELPASGQLYLKSQLRLCTVDDVVHLKEWWKYTLCLNSLW